MIVILEVFHCLFLSCGRNYILWCGHTLLCVQCPHCAMSGFAGQLGWYPHCSTHDWESGVWPQSRWYHHAHEEHRFHWAGSSSTQALVLFSVPSGADHAAHPLPLRVLPQVPQEPKVSAEAFGMFAQSKALLTWDFVLLQLLSRS